MSEFKTLNDCKDLKEARQEAIKRYKFYDCEKKIKNKKAYRDFLIICAAKKDLLVKMFDLKEEDLK